VTTFFCFAAHVFSNYARRRQCIGLLPYVAGPHWQYLTEILRTEEVINKALVQRNLCQAASDHTANNNTDGKNNAAVHNDSTHNTIEPL